MDLKVVPRFFLCGMFILFSGSCSESPESLSECSNVSEELVNLRDLSGTYAEGVTASPTLGVFVGGQLTDNWTVQRSTSGATWSTVDSQATTSMFGGLGTAPDGSVYAVGGKYLGGGLMPWKVRKTTDGTTWEEKDSYNLVADTNARAWGIAFSGSGHVYVVGDAHNGSTFRWIVRRSVDAGANWTTVDDFLTGTISNADAVAVAPDGAVYVAGSASVGGKKHWIVRKSADGATGWTTVDDFQLTVGNDSEASSVAIDSTGTIFVAGRGGSTATNALWTVRRSTDAGATWETVDTPSRTDDHAGGPYGIARAVSVNSRGEIWVAGNLTAVDFSGVQRFVFTIRRSQDGGDTWSEVESPTSVPPLDVEAFDMAIDSDDQVYVVGKSYDYWYVKRFRCW